MTIYYNPAYSASPFRNNPNKIEFGNIYCGDIQLLQKMLFYAGIPFLPATTEERVAHYHTNIQRKITNSSLFYESLRVDSAGMSRVVLMWRDALVEVGWDMKAYGGCSAKLLLIRDVEPDVMPHGVADYWCQLLRIAATRRILPTDVKVVVTCREQEVKPNIAYILAKQQERGVSVAYCPIESPLADGNLGKIQNAILNKSSDKITLAANDDTFCYMRFATNDDALRFIATEPVNPIAAYYCSNTKRLDNTLKLLGKPASGSSHTLGLSQVVQLFTLGNGLFEYPLNIHRIIEWLNMPISPIDNGLRRALSKALIKSGGVGNAEWIEAQNEYLKTKNEKERKEIINQYNQLLPLPKSEEVDINSVKEFNICLQKWATKLLAIKEFICDDIVREQLSYLKSFCSSLVTMLDNAPAGFKFIDLQLWCNNISQIGAYAQYVAEVGSHNTITSLGDIHNSVEQVVWVAAEDEGVAAYPFDMLNEAEYAEVENTGAMLYSREQHALICRTMMCRILLNAKRITIIEAGKSDGAKTARHPLVLQLDKLIDDGLEAIARTAEISNEYKTTDCRVNNQSENPMIVQIEDGICLKGRHEHSEQEDKKTESYTSVDNLIQHPYRYVCERCAKLKDNLLPSAQDLNKTIGKVAHLIIEKVFAGRSIAEAARYYLSEYDVIFEEAVNEKGLLLLLPENVIELRRLKVRMRTALRKLADVIKANNLSVVDCEYVFKQNNWCEAGDGVVLDSRADMLLDDNNGGKVIFDFKYTYNKPTYYKDAIAENRALQLEFYRFVAKQEFGTDVPIRVAYVILPDVLILTADKFEEVEPINVNSDRASIDIMSEAANSYRFRWEQLKAGKIERIEGALVGAGEYGELQSVRGLFPLGVSKGRYNEDKFDNGYKNLK